MTTDEMQLLRDFRKEVPAPDEETMRRAYAYATSGALNGRHKSLRLLGVRPLRLRLAVPVAAAVGAAVCAVVFSGALGSSGTDHASNHMWSAYGPQNTRPGIGGTHLLPDFPAAKQIAVADASAALGAPVVLPSTSLVQPSDAARAMARGNCPYAEADSHSWGCWVSISFPAQSLRIGYSRPLLPNTPAWYGGWANHTSNGSVINLNGVPALQIPENVGSDKTQPNYPGWIEFAVGGTRIVVAGYHDSATLRDLALSILSQTGGSR